MANQTGDERVNVVLSADSTAYQQSMDSSVSSTNKVIDTVGKLTTAMDGLFRSSGRKLELFSGGAMAGLVAAGVAAGRLESQMVQLNASITMSGKSMDVQSRMTRDYTATVSNLRSEFGSTSDAAIQLISQLNKMGQSSQEMKSLTDTLTKLSAVSGENVSGLTDGLISLQRQMGTTGSRSTKIFAADLATLSQTAGVSATSVLSFANSIAPVAKVAGISTKEILGISTAFNKAGADGYTASNTFTKMLTDITRATQYGSPQLKEYSDLIGVSVEQFTKMGKTEAVTRIFEEINKQGPDAIKTLERFGLDGVRSIKAVQAVSNQGGIRASVAEAALGGDPKALDKAGTQAFEGFNDQLKKMAENGKQISEAFGSGVLPILTAMAKAVNSILSPVNTLMQALGKMPGLLTLVGAAAVGTFGMMLKHTMGLSAFGMLAGPGRTMRQGFQSANVNRDLSAREINALNSHQAWGLGQDAEGNNLQHRLYGGAQRLGNRFYDTQARNAALGHAPGPWAAAGRQLDRFGGGVVRAGSQFVRAGLDPISMRAMWGNNFNRDQAMTMTTSPSMKETLGWNKVKDGWSGVQEAFKGSGGTAGTAGVSALGTAAARAAVPLNTAANSATGVSGTFAVLRAESMAFGKALVSASAATGIAATRGALGLGGAAIGRAAGPVGGAIKSAFNSVGGLGTVGLIGGMWAYGQYQQGKQASKDIISATGNSSPGAMYAQAVGDAARSTQDFADAVRKSANQINNTEWHPKTTDQDVTNALAQKDYTNPALQIAGSGRPDFARATVANVMSGNPTNAQKTLLRTDLLKVFGGEAAGRAAVDKMMSTKGAIDFGPMFSLMQDKQKYVFGSNNDAKTIGISTSNAIQEQYANRTPAQQADLKTTVLNQAAASVKTGASSNKVRTLAASVLAAMGKTPTDESVGEMTKILQNAGMYGGSADSKTRAVHSALAGSNSDLGKQFQDIFGATSKDFNQFSFNDPLVNTPQNPWASTGLSGEEMGRLRGKKGPVADLFSANANFNVPGASSQVRDALSNQADPAKQWTGMKGMADEMLRTTHGFAEASAALDKVKASASDASAPLYQLATSAQGLVAQLQSEAMNYMSKPQQAQELLGNYQQAQQTARDNPDLASSGPDLEKARAAMAGLQGQTKNDLKSFALQYREFTVSRDRGEQDYNLQRQYNADDFARSQKYQTDDFYRNRGYSEQDFSRQQKRSSEDFYRSRKRAETAYNLQRSYSTADFNRQRLHGEQDFQHQVVLMTQETAKTMTNIYERINVQRTWSAQNLIQNMADQQKKLDEAQINMDRLRKAGVSNATLTQMDLNNPANAQQLARLADDVMADPKLAAQLNAATKARTAVASKIVTSMANTTYAEMTRSYKLNLARGDEEFAISLSRQAKSFALQLAQSMEDFKRAQARQATDFAIMEQRSLDNLAIQIARSNEQYQIGVQRMADAYTRTLARAQEDLNRSMTDITNSFTELATLALSVLTGAAHDQLAALLAVLKQAETAVTGTVQRTEKQLATLDRQNGGAAVGGGDSTPRSQTQQIVQSVAAKYGWGTGSEWQALFNLIMGESGFNNTAQNPTSSAYGMFQFLNSTWSTVGGSKTSDPTLQATYGLKYIQQRYGDPMKAWSMWQSRSPHWYEEGSVFNKPTHIGVGEHGPEAVIPLNERGVSFFAKAMQSAGMAPGRGRGEYMAANAHNYYQRIDNGQHYHGDITVMAQDLQDFERDLRRKRKVEAMKGRRP